MNKALDTLKGHASFITAERENRAPYETVRGVEYEILFKLYRFS